MVTFETQAGAPSAAARFNVGTLSAPAGAQGGGIEQIVALPIGGDFHFAADIALEGRTAFDGFHFVDLIFDSVVRATFDFDSLLAGEVERARVTTDLVGVLPGNHRVAIQLRRTGFSSDTSPLQYVDNVTLIPEPGTAALLALGLAGLARARRRRCAGDREAPRPA